MTQTIISKEYLIKKGKLNLQDRIDVVKNQLANLKADIAKETKSSAGDKFETARAMIHIEQEKSLKLLNELKGQFHTIDIIDSSLIHSTVGQGSFLVTDKIKLFFSAPIGKIKCEASDIMFLSMLSPIAKAFKGKAKGDVVEFNGLKHTITDVF